MQDIIHRIVDYSSFVSGLGKKSIVIYVFSHISLISIFVYNIICITANTDLNAVVSVPHAGFNWIYILHPYVCVCCRTNPFQAHAKHPWD